MELSKDIDLLSLNSKYNLKFIDQQNNSKTLTWACSCISKKNTKHRGISKFDEDLKMSDSEGNWEEELVNERTKKQKRKVKRTNADACTFRLKFIHTDGVYTLCPKSKKFHNHAPEQCSSQKVIKIK